MNQKFCHNVTLFYNIFPSPILAYPRHKMHDINGISNCCGIRYCIVKYWIFLFINVDGNQNVGGKKIHMSTPSYKEGEEKMSC